MLDYIVHDFENARVAMNDNSIGGMVVCDSSEQAKMMHEIFESKYAEKEPATISMAAEPAASYNVRQKEKVK